VKEDDNGAHRGHRDDIGDAEIGRVDWKGDDAWNVEDGCDQVDGNQKLKITNMLEVGAIGSGRVGTLTTVVSISMAMLFLASFS
jgi:hypothetical protein